ncbi:MAG: GNAT family N-acetyltransferase [Cytophagaceae bacterium]|nr:MAG: GNAT family N-acetyltransferase [Cytophagaceae bacterium]
MVQSPSALSGNSVAASIRSITTHLPEQVLTNDDLTATFPDWSAEKILSKLGIRERRIAAADETAADLAFEAGRKLLENTPGAIEDSQGTRIRQLSVEEAKALADQAPEGADSLKYVQIRHAARACEGGVPRAHFLDGRTDDALLGELFSIEGVGTMIYADAYQQIRAARRMDVPGIMQLVKRAVDDEELVSRSRHEIRENLGDYFVLEVDGQIVGTVSVHSYPEEKLAEVGFLYIKRTHEGMGFGRKLVSFAERRARAFGAKTIFALSTQAYNFFENKLGFLPADDALLPPDRLEKLRKSGRNSRLMAKVLRG